MAMNCKYHFQKIKMPCNEFKSSIFDNLDADYQMLIVLENMNIYLDPKQQNERLIFSPFLVTLYLILILVSRVNLSRNSVEFLSFR